MGANNFESVAAGRTVGEAFEKAVEHARYKHGHGGYSGTIAEKGGFIHVAIPASVRYETFVKLMDEADGFESSTYADYNVDAAKAYGVGARKKYGGKTLKMWEAEAAKERRKREAFWTRVRKKPGLEAALKRAISIAYGDKWGPALALGPLTGAAAKTYMGYYPVGVYTNGNDRTPRLKRGHRLYVFTGYASS